MGVGLGTAVVNHCFWLQPWARRMVVILPLNVMCMRPHLIAPTHATSDRVGKPTAEDMATVGSNGPVTSVQADRTHIVAFGHSRSHSHSGCCCCCRSACCCCCCCPLRCCCCYRFHWRDGGLLCGLLQPCAQLADKPKDDQQQADEGKQHLLADTLDAEPRLRRGGGVHGGGTSCQYQEKGSGYIPTTVGGWWCQWLDEGCQLWGCFTESSVCRAIVVCER